MSRRPKRVNNRIATLREEAGLTQRALGARMATTRQQIQRMESGEEVGPGMALAIARALDKPFEEVFPGIQPPTSNIEWTRLGFDVRAPSPTFFLNIQLHGYTEPYIYLTDHRDCERIIGALIGPPCPADFLAFESEGREIYFNTKEVVRITLIEEAFSLTPGTAHDVGQLTPEHTDLRVLFRDRAEPLTVSALDLPGDQVLHHSFFALAGAPDCADAFVSFRDDEDDFVCLRADALALIEAPTGALIEEVRHKP